MATQTSNPAAPQLTFPREIFAALSPSPFLLAHLNTEPALRPNGRTPTSFRQPTTNLSSLTHCNGSAVVRLGDTAVVCGIRGEILHARDVPNPPKDSSTVDASTPATSQDEDEDDRAEIEGLGLLVPNIELATGASPKHLPGSPPTAQAQSLTARLLSLLHTTRLVRARDLRIAYTEPSVEGEEEEPQREVKAWWTLYIDILFISLDGNAFDAAWGAVLAALADTKLPRAWWERDLEMVLCDDKIDMARGLSLRGCPIAATWAVFENREMSSKGDLQVLGLKDKETRKDGDKAWLLADPDTFEEALCRELVTVVVDCQGGKKKIMRVENSGGGVVGMAVLKKVVKSAEKRWKEWQGVLSSRR